MAFDYTNNLENTSAVDGDFSFVNRDGNASTLKASNTAGEWCLSTDGKTASSGTGPTSNPSGRNGFVYMETSTPAVSDKWEMKRKTSFDASADNIYIEYLYNNNVKNNMTMYLEYATVASPNSTTDWTAIKTYVGNETDAWVQETVDLSGQNTTTLWIRFRADCASEYVHDFAMSTWREYGTTKNEVISSTTDSDAGADQVNESASNGTAVGITALATDADGDTITYSLTDDASGRFAIDSSTGVVTVADASSIVYANNTSHSITIRSTSADTSTSDLTVVIQVLDNSPHDIDPLTDSDSGQNIINEICNNGDPVGVTALANDANVEDTVTYELTNNAGGRFIIDSSTGLVTVLDSTLIVYANDTSHIITVKATSTDSSTSTENFVIIVQKEILAQLARTIKFNTIKTTGVIRVKNGAVPDGLTIIGHLIVEELIDINDVNIINGVLEFETAGTLTATECNISEVTNTSGGNITIFSNKSNFITVTGPNINVITSNTLKFTGLVENTELRIYSGTDPYTAVEIGGIEDVVGDEFSFSHGSGGVNGYARIVSVGYEDIYMPLEPIPDTNSAIAVQQRIDRNYKNPT